MLNNRHFLFLLLFIVSYPLLLNPNFTFSNSNLCDSVIYYGLNFLAGEKIPWNFFYANDRLPVIIPTQLIYSLFTVPVANLLNYLLFYFGTLAALYFALIQIFNRQATQLCILIYACNPLFTALLNNDYPATKVEVYSYLALAFMFKAGKSVKKNHLWYFLAGLFYATALYSNVKTALYNMYIPLVYFTSLNHEDKNLKSFLRMFLIFTAGSMLSTAFFGAWNYFIFNKDFIFFKNTLIQIGRSQASYVMPIEHRFQQTATLATFALSAGVILGSLVKKKLSAFDFFAFTIVTIHLIYGFSGGEYFVDTSAIWSCQIYILLIAHHFIKNNENLISIRFLLPTILFCTYIGYKKNFFFQRILFNHFNISNVFVYIIFSFFLYIIYKKFKQKFIKQTVIFLLFLYTSFLRPDLIGASPWLTRDDPYSSLDEYINVEKAINKLLSYNFDGRLSFWMNFEDRPSRSLIASAFAGCYTESQIDFPYYDLSQLMDIEALKYNKYFVMAGEKSSVEEIGNKRLKRFYKKLEYIDSFYYGEQNRDLFHVFRSKRDISY